MKMVKTLFFSIFLFGVCVGTASGQTTYYSENFTDQDGKGATGTSSGTTSDLSGVDWWVDVGTTLETDGTTNQFEVVSGVFSGIDVDGSAYWFSPVIDVSTETAVDLHITLGIIGNGANAAGENMTVYYTTNPSAGTPTYTSVASYDQNNDSALPLIFIENNIDVSSTNEMGLRIEIDSNGGGDGFSFDNISVVKSVVKAEPSNHVSAFDATSSSIERIEISWVDADNGTLPDGYLILGNTSGAFSPPNDGNQQSDDNDLSDDEGNLSISQGVQSAAFSGLNSDTKYFFEIYPYTNSGSEIDYKTDGMVPSDSVTTLKKPDLVLNEIFSDPATDLTGDANGDGVRSAINDEFLEFVNTGNTNLSLSGWKIEVGGSLEHTFSEGTVLRPMQAIVIFGGGNPTGDFGNAIVQTASGIGLSNSGETVQLKDSSNNTLIYYEYSGASDQSETRSPDLTGEFSDHAVSDTVDSSLFSPGTRMDGSTFQPRVEISGSEGWRILSSPVSNTSYSVLLNSIWTQGISSGADASTGEANVFIYDGSSFTALDNLLANTTAGTGFAAYIFSDDDFDGNEEGFPKTIEVFAKPNTGSVRPVLNPGADAWTLVGNPYASTIDWDHISKTDLTGTVYVYDHSYGTPSGSDVVANGSAGGYRVWNGTSGSLTDGLIPPFQGFWVQNSSSAINEALTIEEDDKTNGGTFYKNSEKAKVIIKLRGETDTMVSEAFLSFTNTGEVTKDNNDGLTLSPLDFRDYLSVATLTGNTKLDVNNLPIDFDGVLTIPVTVESFRADIESGAWVNQEANVSLRWPAFENIPDNWTLILHDYEIGAAIDMRRVGRYDLQLTEEVRTKLQPAISIFNPQPPQAEPISKGAGSTRLSISITASTSLSNEREYKPNSFSLGQNYPNPFNPKTSIQFSIAEKSLVTLSIYNVMGHQIKTLLRETKPAGTYRVSLDASNMASGIYFYRLQSGSQVLTRKMTMIK